VTDKTIIRAVGKHITLDGKRYMYWTIRENYSL
jgi:hypothetical protein